LLIHGFLRAMARTSGTDRRAGLPAATSAASPTQPHRRRGRLGTPPATPLRLSRDATSDVTGGVTSGAAMCAQQLCRNAPARLVVGAPTDARSTAVDVHASLADVVGNTPLVRLNRVTGAVATPVYVKLEYVNPGGSVKDRAALSMVEAARRTGSCCPAAPSSRAPRATRESGLAMIARSRLLFSGDRENAAVARCAAIMARPTPVLPEVALDDGCRRAANCPSFSAASTIDSAARSFTLPPGLTYSSFT